MTKAKPQVDKLFRSLEKGKIYTQKELRENAQKMGIIENAVLGQVMNFTTAHMEQLDNFKYHKK